MTSLAGENLDSPQTASSSKDYVYHVTLGDRLGILQDGLFPNPNRGDDAWRTLEKRVDEHIPERVAVLGISRANAVFAHVEKGLLNTIFNKRTNSLRKATAHMIALQIEVHPEEVIVCDSFLLNYVCDPNTPEKYWNTAMTLQQYRNYYSQRLGGFDAVRRENAPQTLPYMISGPEVLIPGPVDPSQISWFASSANQVSQHVYEFMQTQALNV